MKQNKFKSKKFLITVIIFLTLIILILTTLINLETNNNNTYNKTYNNSSEIMQNLENNQSKINNICPKNYIAIPGGFDVDEDGINESLFCVMKYEAKKDNNIAISIPKQKPWVNISQNEAREKCENLGKGYSLITNKQWIQIAKIAVYTDENWLSNTVGKGALFRGHSDEMPYHTLEASFDDNDGYYNTDVNIDDYQKRIFIIKNGILGNDSNLDKNYTTIIWDFAGNIWEWNNDTIDCSNGYPCEEMPELFGESRNYELPKLTNPGSYFKTIELLRPNDEWSSEENIGRVYLDGDEPIPKDSKHGLARGGIWYDKDDAGLFTAYLGVSPNFSKYTIGFRCIYIPQK